MDVTSNGYAPALLGRLAGVRETGAHKWQACCPAHDDERASLSVSQSSDGTTLVKCHANCATKDVLDAVGMTLKDLFPSNGSRNGHSRIVAEYEYRDADGQQLFQAVRFDPKDFRQRQSDGNGGWIWSVKGCQIVPYRLPELLAEPNAIVFVVEGERDVDRLRSHGLVATCNSGGAGKWRADHAQYLKRRFVAILADNDDAGRKHADQVLRSLDGIAAEAAVVELPNLPPKGDVSDWLDAGGTVEELMKLVAKAGEAPAKPTIVDQEAPSRHATDVGNGERFAEQHGANVRYCHQMRKWFVFNGRYWGLDTSGEVIRLGKRTSRSIYVEASNATDKQERIALAKWAELSERRDRLSAMIALAESEQPIPISAESLDAEPHLLNFENGTLDLRTGRLREHRREDFLTKCCPIEYPVRDDVEPVLWLSTLDRIFSGDSELIGFLQRLMGLSLVGEVVEHILVICYGPGGNGKSVAIETWCGMLGDDYAMKAPPGLLIQNKGDRHPTELADLQGKRLVAAVETADGARLSEVLVKELTGGDTIRARRMREDFWQFQPSHLTILATNHRPAVYGTDNGIWRRLRLLPFTTTIPEAEQDKHLGQKLRAEWPAIMRWAVAGCLDWQRSGLRPPAAVMHATADYRSDMDSLGDFLEDECLVGDGMKSRASELYKRYREWTDERGERAETQKRFGLRLGERGFAKDRDSGNRVIYIGVGLLPEGPEGPEGFSV